MGRVVVTGGAGFVGSHLAEKLLDRGDEVIAVDNLLTGSVANIAHLQTNSRFSFLKHDVTKPLEVAGVVDAVLHFASPASPVDYLNHPIATLKVGAMGTYNLLGLARARHAKFLLASTSEVYGDPLEHPQREEYWGNVNPVGVRSCYDEAKRYAEALTMAYQRAHGVDTRVIRIFNTYGPRMRVNDGRIVPNFIRQALDGDDLTVYGDGKQTRSFCYVTDLVDGVIRLLDHKFHEPVNLGNPNEMTVLDFAEKIIGLVRSKSRIVFSDLPLDDPKVRRPDITRAQQQLGWTPRVGLEEGLNSTIEYFRSQRPGHS